MARKPHLRSVAAASARSAVSPAPSAAYAAPGAALASPPAPTHTAPNHTPCRALLGPRPLIDGEDETNYEVILERISADVAPADFVEEIWVRNVVDLVWDSVRLRRLKSQLLQAAAHEGLERLLASLIDWMRAGQLSRKWALGDEEAMGEVERLLGRELIGRARRIAEAQVDLMRVARARRDIIAAISGISNQRSGISNQCSLVAILSDISARLARLDWYERAALSRRKRAIAAFDAARRMATRRRRPTTV
jgi:hypothetical protein